MERNVLVESYSPCCEINAFVEQDDNTCFFYLWVKPNSEHPVIHSCFVSNVKDKNNAISMEEWLASGPDCPPMIPYEQVTHSEDGLTFDEDLLEIAWTQEGTGAGLLYNGELIAFIPEWSNHECPGFSKYIKGTTPYGWEMTQAEENLRSKLDEGRRFWQAISEDYWPVFQKSHLTSIENYIGDTDKYYAIDGGQFPPKALVTGEKDNVLYGITLGVSALRQPQVESFYQEETRDFSRIELGFACKKEQVTHFMPMLQRLSGLSELPWDQITFLGHGHTIACDDIDGFAAVWLLNANLIGQDCSPDYELAFGERVILLWAVPITQEEYEFLLNYDMKKIGNTSLEYGIHIFDGAPKLIMNRLANG